MLAYVLIVLAAEHFAEQVQHSVELMLEVYWVVLLVDGLLHWCNSVITLLLYYT